MLHPTGEIGFGSPDDEMEMSSHQAVIPPLPLVAAEDHFDLREKASPVGWFPKGKLAIDSQPRDVVDRLWLIDSEFPRHLSRQ
jgi:hypothetical protein